MEVKNQFKAIFNPYTKELIVQYGDKGGAQITYYKFDDLDEWTCINYNCDPDQPYYLHTHLDYDETLQLLFYPRKDNDESLHEDLGSYYNSGEKINSKNIKLVQNDREWDNQLKTFFRLEGFILDTHKKINY